MSRLVSTTSYPTEDKEGSYSLNPPNYSLERSKRQTAHRMRLEESCLPVMVVVCWLYIKLYLVESGILHACQKNICSVFQPVSCVFILSCCFAVCFVCFLFVSLLLYSSSAPRMVNNYKRTSSPRSPTNSGELFTPAHEENVRFIHDSESASEGRYLTKTSP